MKTGELIGELKSCKGGEDLVLEEDTIDAIIQRLREHDELKELLEGLRRPLINLFGFFSGI